MTENEQIEELENHLYEIEEGFIEYCDKPCTDCEHNKFLYCVSRYKAERLYADGYRKVERGEWVTNAWDGKKWIVIPYQKHEHIGAHCSLCNKRALLNYDKDEVTSNFCPNCGADMRGAE